MKTSRVAVAAGLLVLAAAGCSSSSDTPSPEALASSIQAQATSPAAGSGSPAADSGSGDCADAVLAAKAALAGLSVTDVSLPEGCTVIAVTTPLTDPLVGKDMCDKVAGEVYQMGINGVTVASDSGKALALGAPSQPCAVAP